MRICVVSRRDPTRDPHVKALVASLVSAGHQVAVVCGTTPRGVLAGAHIIDAGPGSGAWSRVAGGLTGKSGREMQRVRSLRTAIETTRPDLLYPATAADIDIVVDIEAPTVRLPGWPEIPRDLIAIAPHDTRLSSSPGGNPAPFHQPGDIRPAWVPAPGRHGSRRIAVAARFTATNPSRYLVAALERAGMDVVTLDGVIDGDRIPPDAAGVVIVESPLPPLEIVGTMPDVPVAFWVHHGEHHLAANLRLTRRYGADAVLLAHSWHLAHRFPVPVHRFPFAVAPELFGGPMPFDERPLDVAMVGAGLGNPALRYDTRQQLATDLGNALVGRTAFRSGLAPEELAALYGRAHIVLNEGGARHFPLTMRVFEALGAGALLLTDDLPGTDVVLERGIHYLALGDDPVRQILDILDDPSSAEIAAAGRRHAMSHHTYDHRVDELLAIVDVAAHDPSRKSDAPGTSLDAVVDGDVDAHSVAAFGVQLDLPDRVVRYDDDAFARLAPGKTDAVVIGPGGVDDVDRVIAAARRYVYATGTGKATVRSRIAAIHPEAVLSDRSDVLRADLLAPGYRIAVDGEPAASAT